MKNTNDGTKPLRAFMVQIGVLSNHQNGRALDLTTSPWLTDNAARFGFRRTVPSEAWHYEFSGADPGGPCGN